MAFPESYTFSDKIASIDCPCFYQSIIDCQTDTMAHGKVELGDLNNISGCPRKAWHRTATHQHPRRMS